MASYADVASLSQTIHLILSHHQHSVSPQFKNQITSLHKHIIFLRSFLEDCPDEAHSWEERICAVTNVAEDIIELLLSDSLLEATSSKSKGKHEVRRRDLGELERVSEEIESIAEGVKERHKEAVDDSNDDLKKIISQLRRGFSWRQTIAIVGRGGIGKTTLARNAYNHPLIVEHFEIRAWVTVSQDYSCRGIVSSLLSSMNRSNADDVLKLKSKDELCARMGEIMRDKRYLIVLDDVWSREAWDTLKTIFPHSYKRSRIMLTARNQSVVAASDSHIIHKMRLLNVDQSWSLLRQMVFKGNPCPPMLKYMGKKIAISCGGLPLTIAAVSGILAADQTEAAWEDIAENLNTGINSEDNEHLFQILSLSYTHLPHYLRPYLLYLGIFPEDHEIRVSKLIKLWVAEGFLNELGEFESLEKTGEEYLEDLAKKSLVCVTKRKCNGRIKSLSIHDFTREMCIMQAQLDDFFHLNKLLPTAHAIKHQRRVSTLYCHIHLLQNVCGSTIRTMICLEGNEQGFQQWLGYFRLLRILDLSYVYNFWEPYGFPDQVFELFHLRYLAFSHPFSIRKAISNLENLQTLIIHPRKHQRQFVKLPVEIWRMRQLRHLVVHSCLLPRQEEGAVVFPLEDLTTLSKAVDLICSREMLQMTPNLKKLCITFTSWRDPHPAGKDYQLDNLVHLQKLETLKIKVDDRLKKLPRIRPPAFHRTLKKLNLIGLGLAWEDMKIVGTLPNLQVLKLRKDACIGHTWETSEGGFSQLTFFMIERSDLKRWITKSSHFPKLKWLVLRHCWRMSKVPRGVGEIQTLELIQVDRWNKTQLQSAKRIQEDRRSLGNDPLQIRIV